MILLTVSLIPSIIVKKYKKAVNKLKKIEIKLECFSQTPSSVSNNFSIFCPQPPYSSYSNEPILFLIHIFVYQISQEKFDIGTHDQQFVVVLHQLKHEQSFLVLSGL